MADLSADRSAQAGSTPPLNVIYPKNQTVLLRKGDYFSEMGGFFQTNID
jgi:hypothetical protein